MTQAHQTPRRLFLVGPMGAGKTTIGHTLANKLGFRFVDSDREIEHHTGATIPLIFELEGEDGFRRREMQAIDELTQLDDVVLATGGGAVLRPENRELLKSRGWVIYLHATVEQLFQRTAKDRHRPLLQTDDPRATLRRLMEIREPLYRDVASLTVDTTGKPVTAVVQEILTHMGSARAGRA